MDDNRHPFFSNNLVIGININDVVTLSYTRFWGTVNINDRLSQFSTITIEPDFM
jgi:hypothetical protein